MNEGEAGYTLVELLVTLAILAILVVYSNTALSTLRTVESVSDHLDQQERVEAARQFVKRAIAGSEAVYRQAADGSQQTIFEGSNSDIRFLTISDGTREVGGLYESRIFLSAGGELLYQNTLFERDGSEPDPPRVLLSGVRAVEFSYYDCPLQARSQARTSWQSHQHLPFAVRVVTKFETNDFRLWPETTSLIASSGC